VAREDPCQRAIVGRGLHARARPHGLERLLLQCLAKSPADRPPDAGSLLEQLDACSRVTPWSTERAAAWWRVFRQQHPAVAAAEVPEALRATAVIDLASRQ
jgi:hypothetical protein